MSHPPDIVSGTITSYIPLTTTWPAVTECFENLLSATYNDGTASLMAFDPWVGQYLDKTDFCLPPQATSSYNQFASLPVLTETDIGPIVCPELFYTATSEVLDAQTTGVICCPSSYTFNESATACQSNLQINQTITYWEAGPSVVPLNASHNARVTVSDIVYYWYHQTVATPKPIYAFPVNGYNFPPPAHKGLSKGAKAGIVVSVIAGVGMVIGICFWAFLIRKSKLKKRQDEAVKAHERSAESGFNMPEGFVEKGTWEEKAPMSPGSTAVGSPDVGMNVHEIQNGRGELGELKEEPMGERVELGGLQRKKTDLCEVSGESANFIVR
ncbi:hypothetical protein B0J14DRAFT_285591 [Halenospora varia]|nr:hypothetical protein B0J14DRAFT_285591 [Halenospora varia]